MIRPVRSISAPRAGVVEFVLAFLMLTFLSGRLAVAMPWGTGASRLRLRGGCSATQLSEGAEEHVLPGIPTQDSVNQLPAGTHDLTRDPYERIHKGLELHPQHDRLFVPMLPHGQRA